MEQVFGRMGGNVGLGGLMASSFLSTIADAVIGSMIAQQFLSHEIGPHAGGQSSGVDANLDAGDYYAADDASDEIDTSDFDDG
ncbi:MAG: hypothetical protein ACREX4_17475 [Gammaproteobacteria bacterium]